MEPKLTYISGLSMKALLLIYLYTKPENNNKAMEGGSIAVPLNIYNDRRFSDNFFLPFFLKPGR